MFHAQRYKQLSQCIVASERLKIRLPQRYKYIELTPNKSSNGKRCVKKKIVCNTDIKRALE